MLNEAQRSETSTVDFSLSLAMTTPVLDMTSLSKTSAEQCRKTYTFICQHDLETPIFFTNILKYADSSHLLNCSAFANFKAYTSFANAICILIKI